MSKYPEGVSITDRVTCLEQDVARVYAKIFPSRLFGTGEASTDLLKRLEGRVDDLERRLGPSPDSDERKQQISDAIDTPSDRKDLQ